MSSVNYRYENEKEPQYRIALGSVSLDDEPIIALRVFEDGSCETANNDGHEAIIMWV